MHVRISSPKSVTGSSSNGIGKLPFTCSAKHLTATATCGGLRRRTFSAIRSALCSRSSLNLSRLQKLFLLGRTPIKKLFSAPAGATLTNLIFGVSCACARNSRFKSRLEPSPRQAHYTPKNEERGNCYLRGSPTENGAQNLRFKLAGSAAHSRRAAGGRERESPTKVVGLFLFFSFHKSLAICTNYTDCFCGADAHSTARADILSGA